MQTLSQVLVDLVKSRVVSKEDALRFATNKEELERSLGGFGGGVIGGGL
jgi:Tfp pilus assembly pilus retraction ATPase PilT